MGVSGVNTGTNNTAALYNTGATKTAAETLKEDNTAVTTEADSYEKSVQDNSKTATYKRDTAKLRELSVGQKAYLQGLQSMVSQLFTQSTKAGAANGQKTFLASGVSADKVTSYWDVLVDNGDGTYSIDPALSKEDQAKLISKAKEDIGENGYYGVKQTSQRILDFAKAVTGGDPSKIGEMRKMAQAAFDDVKRIMGGKLPEISQKTYDAVMKGFDEWEAQSKAAN